MSISDALRNSLAERYRIERELGVGGMATVYLAEDLKHDRKVAIKVLKPELAAVLGADRFVVEIKTTAALQHPHILPLFDSGTAGGFLYYVMPYIEGETIREKLNRETQLGTDEAVRIACEIADALDYAHRHGVIHRDIKPENILLHDGRAMVMDFGIALAVSAAAGGRMTETGLSLGTPHYMSPEQATAEKDISARSDVYSLASVTYEMLAGNPPHTGASAQQVIMKIITEPVVPVSSVRKSVPEYVSAALSKALEKLPADRFASASEFALALQGRGDAALLSRYTHAGTAGHADPNHRRTHTRELVAWVLAVVAMGGGAWALARPHPAESTRIVRFLMAMPDSERATQMAPYSAAISPDGTSILYAVASAAGWHLQAYRTDQLDSRAIPGTEHATQPIFSPDGRSIAFESGNKLRRTRLDGSGVTVLSNGSTNDGAAWTLGDEIILGADAGFHGLSRVSANGGGQLVELTRPDSAKGETEHWYPVAVDDGNTIVFSIVSGALASSELAITSLDGGKVTRLGLRGFRPLAVVDGMLVYLQVDGVAMTVPLDARGRRVIGKPTPAFGPVTAAGGNAEIFISRGGALVASWGGEKRRLMWFGRDGSAAPVTPEARAYGAPTLSRDGTHIAVTITEGQSSDIWIIDVATRAMVRLTSVETAQSPAWSADGKRVYFIADGADTKPAIWVQAVSGGSPMERIANVTGVPAHLTASPDGVTLVYTTWAKSSYDVIAVRLDSAGSSRAFVATELGEQASAVSPDGKWVAVVVEESGVRNLYIRSYPDARRAMRISTDGAGYARWSGDGKQLFYQSGSTLLVAKLAEGPDGVQVISRDTVLRQTTLNRGLDDRYGFDVSNDGARFLGLAPEGSAMQFVVSPNWIVELREKLAARKK